MLTQLVCAAITPMHWPARKQTKRRSTIKTCCKFCNCCHSHQCASAINTSNIRCLSSAQHGIISSSVPVPKRNGLLPEHRPNPHKGKQSAPEMTPCMRIVRAPSPMLAHQIESNPTTYRSAPEMTSYMRAVLLAQPRMAKRVQGDSATHSTPPVGMARQEGCEMSRMLGWRWSSRTAPLKRAN